jgi:sigma-B regulation protein RsbU (phosphoserine phosphatase)
MISCGRPCGNCSEDEAAARRIQFQLLPENDKLYRSYRFSRHLLTSQYLSGDFVDYFAIDGDHLGFYIADVSGHGVSSAFVTVMLKSYMGRYRELHRQNRDKGILNPAETLEPAEPGNVWLPHGQISDHVLWRDRVVDQSTCATAAAVSFRSRSCSMANRPVMWAKRACRLVCSISPTIRPNPFNCRHAFAMVFISDGILETLPQPTLRDKQAFLLELVGHTELKIENLIQALGTRSSRNLLPDDVTLLLVERMD